MARSTLTPALLALVAAVAGSEPFTKSGSIPQCDYAATATERGCTVVGVCAANGDVALAFRAHDPEGASTSECTVELEWAPFWPLGDGACCGVAGIAGDARYLVRTARPSRACTARPTAARSLRRRSLATCATRSRCHAKIRDAAARWPRTCCWLAKSGAGPSRCTESRRTAARFACTKRPLSVGVPLAAPSILSSMPTRSPQTRRKRLFSPCAP